MALSGKNDWNSLQSCAARVLLWARTSVGRLSSATILAMVKVLPVPVAPSRTWCFSFSPIPLRSFSIAFGWSPVGEKGATKRNFWSLDTCAEELKYVEALYYFPYPGQTVRSENMEICAVPATLVP